jgi:hypothetical protein
MPLFWKGFIVGIIAYKAFRYLYDIVRGIILYYQIKNDFK